MTVCGEKKAFTLIELLVVISILAFIMAMVAPKGAKMLEAFEKSIQKITQRQKLSKERSEAFLQAKEREVHLLGTIFHISSKGILLQDEKSNDHH